MIPISSLALSTELTTLRTRIADSRAIGKLVVVWDMDETIRFDRKGVASTAAQMARDERLELDPQAAERLGSAFLRHVIELHRAWTLPSHNRPAVTELLNRAHIGAGEIVAMSGSDLGPTHNDFRQGAFELLNSAHPFRRTAWTRAFAELGLSVRNDLVEEFASEFPGFRLSPGNVHFADGVFEAMAAIDLAGGKLAFLTNGLWTSQDIKFEQTIEGGMETCPDTDWKTVVHPDVRVMSGNLGKAKPIAETLEAAVTAVAGEAALLDPEYTVIMYGDNTARDGEAALNLRRKLDAQHSRHATIGFFHFEQLHVSPTNRLNIDLAPMTIQVARHVDGSRLLADSAPRGLTVL